MSVPPDATRWQQFTPEEAAPILGMSRATIYRRLKGKNALPHHYIAGEGVRFTGADLDLILAQGERGRR